MIAAIYARKSTDQRVSDDAKSVTRQIDNAKTFAQAKGWTVEDRHVYKDDGVSGAETKRLRDRQRMLDAAANHDFDVVVMQAQDRFSRRDGDEAFAELKALAKHVQVWFYADGHRFTYGTFESNITGILKSEFAAEYRRAIAVKTHEAMRRRAEQGHVTGGRTFGYDNVRKDGHVERIINSAEATVVRDIYRRYADGEGFKQIAHALNAKKVPSPRPQRGRPAGWDPGTIRAVLRRPLYRGVVVYDRTKKRDLDGARHKGRQPKKDRALWLHVDKPELRIIEPSIITAVDDRLADRRNAYLRNAKGHLLGTPKRHGHNGTKHLLAGFIVCECGATFEVVRGSYVCSARRRKGVSVCTSDFSFNVESIDHVFLDALEEVVLSPKFIDRVLDMTFANQVAPDRDALEQERKRLTLETTNLTSAIAQGGDIPSLSKALKDRDKQLQALDAQLRQPVVLPDRDVLRAALELRTADWRTVLRGPHVAQARLVLQHLLDLPMRVFNAPKPKWIAAAKPEGLAVGLVQLVASPPGFEPGFQP
jgi:site-specific DNA recombinase